MHSSNTPFILLSPEIVIRAKKGGIAWCSTGGTGKGGKGLGATGSAPTSMAPAATVSATGPQVTTGRIIAPAAAAHALWSDQMQPLRALQASPSSRGLMRSGDKRPVADVRFPPFAEVQNVRLLAPLGP
jgi:hypothetical protein